MADKTLVTSTITKAEIQRFEAWLRSEDRSNGTIEKYIRDIGKLAEWLGDKEITKENLILWKEFLLEKGREPATVNSILSAVNTYCRFIGMSIKVKLFRIQRKLFREESKEMSKAEYRRLVSTAERKGNSRLSMLIETIGATGIRVSEVKYITVEAAKNMRTQISLKGKIRVILLPRKLCLKLLKYAKKQDIVSGEIFITKSGNSMSRKQIWAEMKNLCKNVDVEESKVFPHNLRHLFAKVFYKETLDVAKLADVLGHSSINTTRIYLITSGAEHVQILESLGMLS